MLTKTGALVATNTYSLAHEEGGWLLVMDDPRTNGQPNCQGLPAEYVVKHLVRREYVQVAGDTLRECNADSPVPDCLTMVRRDVRQPTLAMVSSQDTTVVAAVRATATHERVEAFKTEKGLVPVHDIQLLDVDGDGAPEAFVAIEPSFRQTPTILVYTYDQQHGARRLLEGLVAGQLHPVSGRFIDDHTIGFGIDMTVGDGSKPVDIDGLIASAVKNHMSLVRYRTFVHADGRKDFVSFADLSDRALPTPGTNTCQDFEFSLVEALAVGTLSGGGSTRYLVALTATDVTLYRFHRIRSNGTLDKEVWLRARPPGVTGLQVAPSGEIRLARSTGVGEPLSAP